MNANLQEATLTAPDISCGDRSVETIAKDFVMRRQEEARDPLEAVRRVRQVRRFRPDPVPKDALRELLEIARWTGSARNSQPWRFVVVADKERLRQLSQVRPPIAWIAEAPLAIAIVLNGANETTEAYDEGRVAERLLVGAQLLGLGGAVAWFGDAAQRAAARQILGVPAGRTVRSVVVLGCPDAAGEPTESNGVPGGRRPLTELVSYERFAESHG